MSQLTSLQSIEAGGLHVSYSDNGPADGKPVLLLHGFPYDVHAYDEVSPLLLAAGCRVIIPYLRGFGPTHFVSTNTPRSGQQAALAADLLAFMEALLLPRAVLAGYDWGGRAACIVAALWPDRVRGLVSGGGYTIQNIRSSIQPDIPENEYRLWYQYYFHSERGRAGLTQHRQEFCRLLWRLWSPVWNFTEETYQRTAASFHNPDFIDVVIHSYRHRFALVPGDPALEEVEQRLCEQPKITVPTIALDGNVNGVLPPEGSKHHHHFFTGKYERRVFEGVGHNLPQEAPRDFATAVLSLL